MRDRLAARRSSGYSSRVRERADKSARAVARLCLGLLIAAGACASLRHNGTSEDETDVVTVKVINHHLLNVTVFNIAQGHRDRLGEVTAAATSSFKLHLRRLPSNEVQLFADPIGSSNTTRTELLRVGAGDTVQWILESDLARSHVEIR